MLGAILVQMEYHSDFDYERANESYEQGFRLWQRSSEKWSADPKPPAPDPLRLVLHGNPITLDPGLAHHAYSNSIIKHLFSGLLEYTPEMDVLPDIAQRWDIQEGGRRYIFHLREDLKWSDRTPVTAEDFVYAWQRVLNPASHSETAILLYDIKGARAFHQGETSETERLGIRAKDPFTLEVELEEPAGYFLQLMAHEVSYPVPSHVVERLGEDWTEADNIICNGPFLIKNWQRDKSMTLVRNLNHSGRFSGNLQSVDICIHSLLEWEIRSAMYEADELDIMEITYFPPEEINRLRRQHSGDYISAPHQSIFFLIFNAVRAPFDDRRIRRAFIMAADIQAGVGSAASGGSVIPATGGLIPPGMPGHSAGIGVPYDPVGAQELMAQAGYPCGSGFPPVEVIIWPDAEVQMEGIRRSWRETLGVEVSFKKIPIIDIEERATSEPFHIYLQGWGADYPDPDNFLRVGFPKEMSGWDGAAFDGLVAKARRMIDQTQRLKLYQEADRILIEEAVVLPLIYGMTHLLVKPWVKRFPISPMGEWFLKDMIIEPH
jgi:oligopeptide transport system substrate-binding protein